MVNYKIMGKVDIKALKWGQIDNNDKADNNDDNMVGCWGP